MKKNNSSESGNYKKAKVKIKIITAVAAAAVLCGTIAGCITAIYHILANQYFKYSMYRLAAVTLRDSLTKWIAYALIFTAAIIVLLFFIRILINKWFPSSGGIFNNKTLRQRVTSTALIMALCFTALNVYLYVDGKINTPKGPNIIIILSDALRRDHMGCYGYKRDTTPNIDSFAGEAVLFTHAFTQSSSTKPSIASMFTSLYPSQHNVIYNEHALPLSCLTLAEVLQEHRYITAGFSENIRIASEFGYHQGFGQWHCGKVKRYQKSKEKFDKQVISWLDRCHKRSFFLYIHFLEPHSPYTPPPPFANLPLSPLSIDNCSLKIDYCPPGRQRQGIIISEQLRRKGRHKPQRCIIYREWKLIHGMDSNSYTLFNIAKDAGDTVDLAVKYPGIVVELKSRLISWQKSLFF